MTIVIKNGVAPKAFAHGMIFATQFVTLRVSGHVYTMSIILINMFVYYHVRLLQRLLSPRQPMELMFLVLACHWCGTQ